jgi:hypothetical protein
MVAPRPLDRKVGSIPSKTQWELHLSVTHQRCIHSIPNLESFTPPSLPSTSCLHACKNSRNCFCCGIGRRHTLKGGVGRKKKLCYSLKNFSPFPYNCKEREKEKRCFSVCLHLACRRACQNIKGLPSIFLGYLRFVSLALSGVNCILLFDLHGNPASLLCRRGLQMLYMDNGAEECVGISCQIQQFRPTICTISPQVCASSLSTTGRNRI